jgi:phage regulator Rha-like protein
MDVVGKIYIVDHKKIMLDFDLAEFYKIPTKRINEQVKRNKDRFPTDFMFQLNEKQWENLRSQFATANSVELNRRRNFPYAFTEHGVLMLSSVLTSPTAIQVNIQLVRIFTKMRDILLSQSNLIVELQKLKNKVNFQDDKMDGVIQYLKRFLDRERKGINRIGCINKTEKSC